MNKKLVFGLAMVSVMLFAATAQFTQAADYTHAGVTVGATADYSGSVSSIFAGSQGANMHIEVTSVSGTSVTIKLNSTYSKSGDISTTAGASLLGWVLIVAGLNVGDNITKDCGARIASQGSESVAWAMRTINHASFSGGGGFFGMAYDIKWDKDTGLLVWMSVTMFLPGMGTMSSTVTLTSTSLWSATLTGILGSSIFLITAGIAAVVIVVAVVVVKRRKKSVVSVAQEPRRISQLFSGRLPCLDFSQFP